MHAAALTPLSPPLHFTSTCARQIRNAMPTAGGSPLTEIQNSLHQILNRLHSKRRSASGTEENDGLLHAEIFLTAARARADAAAAAAAAAARALRIALGSARQRDCIVLGLIFQNKGIVAAPAVWKQAERLAEERDVCCFKGHSGFVQVEMLFSCVRRASVIELVKFNYEQGCQFSYLLKWAQHQHNNIGLCEWAAVERSLVFPARRSKKHTEITPGRTRGLIWMMCICA